MRSAMKSPVPALTPGFDGNLSPYKFDLDKAKALMKEAGVTDARSRSISPCASAGSRTKKPPCGSRRELEKVGFKINITRQTDATFRQLATKGDMQLSIETWQSWVNDPFFHMVPLFHSHLEGHQHGVLQQPVPSTRSSTRTTTSPTPRSALAAAKAAQKIVIDDAVWGMLWYDNWTRVMRNDIVGVEKRWDTFDRFTSLKTG